MSNEPVSSTDYSEVQFFQPDYSLSKRIGKKLEDVFTPQRIQTATKILNESDVTFKKEALQHADELKELCQQGITEESRATLEHKAINLKSSAAIAGYELASGFANALLTLLTRVKEPDNITEQLAMTLISAARAVLKEDRKGSDDSTSKRVLQELSQQVEKHLSQQG